MAVEYHYGIYNVGQYPEQLDAINDMAKQGWRAHTVSNNYSELYIFWEREAAAAEAPAEPPLEPVPVPGPSPVSGDQTDTVVREGSYRVEEEAKPASG